MSKQDGSGRQVTTAPSDDVSATILHIDMDAFYASVELLEHPELAGKPVIVGHRSLRSVVTAATYEARRYGVNSAMPMALALRRCPQAIVLEPHFERYTHYSALVMGLLRDVTPLVEPLSIDEAFLDVAGALRLMGTPWQIGTRLRERVFAETGLSASVGAAATKYVAKLASSRAKPDGLLVVPAASTLTFLHPQPVSALWGVGVKAEEQLTRLGLRTVGDVAEVPVDALVRAVGPANAARLHELAWGRDPRPVSTEREEKSIGHETTFETDVTDTAIVHRTLLSLSNGVAVRLRRAGVQARTVAIKLRFEDFTTISRSRTLGEPTDLARRIYEEARSLYDDASQGGRPVRLIGVRGEQLVGAVASLGLWDDDEAWRDAEYTVDAVASKFGPGAVRPAALLKPSSQRRFGHGDD
ncbi:MAG TPA: DNA polymerase IV [Pseudolysinimonas sp.]|jgi:DNA polymerase-4|nr:DNA polymerase IV [Pseudolysinimonas sp.]